MGYFIGTRPQSFVTNDADRNTWQQVRFICLWCVIDDSFHPHVNLQQKYDTIDEAFKLLRKMVWYEIEWKCIDIQTTRAYIRDIFTQKMY